MTMVHPPPTHPLLMFHLRSIWLWRISPETTKHGHRKKSGWIAIIKENKINKNQTKKKNKKKTNKKQTNKEHTYPLWYIYSPRQPF